MSWLYSQALMHHLDPFSTDGERYYSHQYASRGRHK